MKMAWQLGVALAAGGAVLTGASAPPAPPTIMVYKSESCGCCKKWVEHLRTSGFPVTTHDVTGLDSIKTELGVPGALHSCHTALVSGYVIEGHVPAADINRLLREKPKIAGLAVPGMPAGSPGMEGGHKDAYEVMAFDASGTAKVFARH